eukprot:tig00021319_g20243.t1
MESALETFVTQLRRREFTDTAVLALKTCELCRLTVSGRWSNAQQLMDIIKQAGRKLGAANPVDIVVGNTIRRVLYIIREEYLRLRKEAQDGASGEKDDVGASRSREQHSDAHASAQSAQSSLQKQLWNLMEDGSAAAVQYVESFSKLRQAVIERISDLSEEITNAEKEISYVANEHIHSNEIIMTYGASRTVERFLLAVAKKRKFEVFIAETGPLQEGHELAVRLAAAGIQTTVIPDSCIFAMMARVNKVIVGAHAVMANGGLVLNAGGNVLATAAKHYSVPLVAAVGLYKLSPVYPADQDAFTELRSPAPVLNFASDWSEDVHVVNPVYDYVPPELVQLYVFDHTSNNSSYIYRMLQELYHPDDVIL